MRLAGLDIFRGYAILLMVVFHFSFDINNFHVIEFDIRHGLFWKYFRYFIVSMFVFSAGMSIYLANRDVINYKKVLKRSALLAGASLLVTIGSYTQFPNTWIYFGILHFFLFSTIFGLFFIRIPKVAFIVGVVIIAGYNFGFIHMHWLFHYLQPILHLPIKYTQDLANIIPWFGVFLLGVSFVQSRFFDLAFNNEFFNRKGRVNRSFDFLGRHSLIIYLIHQPILFGFFMLLQVV
ncbi:MAG: heparan-alpha-glucosaminide N-acetyltransferase [Campylobacterota bacterium]|nr:heparan-alpha-glucosaminide N-acetyltransferase [Campylobacterota bacterium]